MNFKKRFLFAMYSGNWSDLESSAKTAQATATNEVLYSDNVPSQVKAIKIGSPEKGFDLSAIPISYTLRRYLRRVEYMKIVPKAVYLGYSVSNRECEISADVSGSSLRSEDFAIDEPIVRLGRDLFGTDDIRSSFDTRRQTHVTVIFNDRSKKLHLSVGNDRIEPVLPPASTDGPDFAHECLTKAEELQNRIHQGGTITYRRNDNAVVCTIANFQRTGVVAPMVEIRRGLDFIQFRQNETCASILGIPLGQQWYILLDEHGGASGVGTECVNGSYTRLDLPARAIFQ